MSEKPGSLFSLIIMCQSPCEDVIDLEEHVCVEISDTEMDTIPDDDSLMDGICEELDELDRMQGGVEYEVSRVQVDRVERGVSPIVRFV